jgi:uncharacterized cupin superfamily protein
MTERVTAGRLDVTEFEPLSPQDGGWELLEGDSNTRVHTLSENARIWAGVALIDPCRFSYEHHRASMIQLLEGEATFTADGRTVELRAGGVAFFLPGMTSTWEVRSPMREFFVSFTPDAA